MSFTTSIAGNCPPSQFVFTTTTVSVDNISAENVSITNASISRLTTDIFSPVNVDATNIECTNLTVFDTGNFSEIYTSYIHMSNASFDGTIGGHTANLVTLNADHCITDELYLNEQSSVLTDKSLVKRDANQIKFIGKSNASDTTGADYVFRTGLETDVVKLSISRNSDVVQVMELEANSSLSSPLGLFDGVASVDINATGDTTLFNLETLGVASIRNLTVIGPNGLTGAKGALTNFSSTNTSIVNLSVDVVDSDLALFSDSSNVADKSRIYRQGNVLYLAQGAVAGDADASIHFYIGPPTGTPPLKIDKNNSKTTAVDFVSDDLFSLRGTINTFNSSSIASPSIEGDAIETENLLFNDKVTSNDSFFRE